MEMEKEVLYQKMTAVFEEREAIYQKRETELNDFREELKKIEAVLAREKEELEQEKKNINAAKEKLALEKEEIEKKREELKQYQESINGILEEILQEKVQLQSLKNERLRQENEQETVILQQSKTALGVSAQTEEVDRESMSRIEISLENEGAFGSGARPEMLKLAEQKFVEQPDKNIIVTDSKNEHFQESSVTEPEGITANVEEPVGLIQQFANKAEVIFPEGNALETSEELFCLAIADKELRIMLQNPPIAVILAKREKNKALLKGISQLNQVQSEWEFNYQDNCLRCMMPFTEATPVDVILQKCADAMTRYFL